MTTHNRSKVKSVINGIYFGAAFVLLLLFTLSFLFPILWWITPVAFVGFMVYTVASFFRLKVPQHDGAVLTFGDAIVEGGTDVEAGFGWRPWPLNVKLYPLSKQMEWKPRVTFHKGANSDTDPLDRQLTAEPVITGWLVVVDKERFLEMGELSWTVVEERVFEALKAALTNQVNKKRKPHKLTLGGFIENAKTVLAEVLKEIRPTLQNYGVDVKEVGALKAQTLELKEDGVPKPIRDEMEKSATKLQEEQGRRDAANLARETAEKEAEAKAKAITIQANAQAGAIEKLGKAKADAVEAMAKAIPGDNNTDKAKIIATAGGNTAGAIAFFTGSTLSVDTPKFLEAYVDVEGAPKPKEEKKPENKKGEEKK